MSLDGGLVQWIVVRGLILVVGTALLLLVYRVGMSAIHRLVPAVMTGQAAHLLPGSTRADELGKRSRTIEDLLARLLRVAVLAGIVTLVLVVLELWPVLALIVILLVAVVFATKDVVLDYVMGLLILIEGQFFMGDYVVVPGHTGVEGVVEEIGLRRTVLRDGFGAAHAVSNGLIRLSSNRTRLFSAAVADVFVLHAAPGSRDRRGPRRGPCARRGRGLGGEARRERPGGRLGGGDRDGRRAGADHPGRPDGPAGDRGQRAPSAGRGGVRGGRDRHGPLRHAGPDRLRAHAGAGARTVVSPQEDRRPPMCPSCGFAVSEGAKFCASCGERLAISCPSCGAHVPAGARFCPECGTGLAASVGPAVVAVAPNRPAGGPTTERRLVSVLFADLVGFTPFAQDRDAEQVRELLSHYFDPASEVVGRYGGTIEKFIGDAVMAVWGTPQAHEDDAERAVPGPGAGRRGHRPGQGIQARAGVMTGEAAATLGAQNQGMVAGDLVNTASRLQSVAAPGTVLVGERTRDASGAAIRFEPAGPQALKGKDAPVAAWRALRAVGDSRGMPATEALEAPFVGRADELRLLKETYHATGRERTRALVSLVARPASARAGWRGSSRPTSTAWSRPFAGTEDVRPPTARESPSGRLGRWSAGGPA